MKKYEQLYHNVKNQITGDYFDQGERLLSLREQASQSGYSLNTVIKAYDLLVDEGFIKTTERGGYYINQKALPMTQQGIGTPHPLPDRYVTEARKSGQRLDQLYAQLITIDPTFACAAPEDDILPGELLKKLMLKLDHSWLNYGDLEGDTRMKQRISLQYRNVSPGINPDDILITNGATEGLALVLQQLLEDGDTLVVESPTYHNYFHQLSRRHVKIIEVPVGEKGLDLDILQEELIHNKVKMVIAQPNVHNPTGITMAEDEKKRLVNLAIEYQFYLLQDDVYGDLSFNKVRPTNLCYYSDSPLIITLSSFSKSIAPGIRLGWIHAKGRIKELAEAKLALSMESNHLSQELMKQFVATKAHRQHLLGLRSALEKRIDDHIQYLSEVLPPGSYIRKPSGACLLWVALPEDIDGTKVFEKAAGKGIIAAPGALFSTSHHFDHYIRLNVGHKLTESRKRALTVLGQTAQELRTGEYHKDCH
ncbi:PLP-dependent aminotransferase family protein [Spirochaeta cellobiosiphila]|uniref:aminotransferase-like domain-containing protein n=1 Tax=Spirochaeta cellobiosiphila TaxID=504483 RepID=UPI000418672D|nr:PLP-dependent aminotransferase family protein [Spirochaeta cellobiosiphila]